MVRVLKGSSAMIAIVGLLAGSLAACGRGGGSGHEGQAVDKDVVLKVATTEPVTVLDPAGPADPGSRGLQANLFQTLLTILPGKPTPVPDAADCQYDAPTVYTCSLKSGLTFPNEHQLTSSDVKFSFDRMLRIKAPSGPARLFSSLASISTPDDLTVVFMLTRPDARLPYLLTTPAGSIVDEEVYPAAKLLPGQAMGSGPYQLASSEPGKRAVLTKFLKYRGVRPARNDGIELSTVGSSARLRQALTSGGADLGLRGLSSADVDLLRADDKVQVAGLDIAELRYFAFDLKSPTTRKLAVRRAVAQLIDRPAIAKRAYSDQVTPLYSLVPPGFSGQVDAFKLEYSDPDKAAATGILRDARVSTPVPLTLGWTPSQYGRGTRAEVQELKRQLEASGLFKVTLRSADWPRFQQLARSGAYDIHHAGMVPEIPDSDDFLAPFVKDYRSTAAIRLRDREATSQNQIDREATLAELQKLMAHDVPVLPSWQGRLTVVAGRDVRNLTDALNPGSFLYYSALEK